MIRGWTPRMEMVTNDMDATEQIQFGNAQLGRALATYVKAAGEVQVLAEKLKKASAELLALREAHHVCPTLIKSVEDELHTLKGEMEILEGRASQAELATAEAREKAEAAERRAETVRAESEARIESSRTEAYARGLAEGEVYI
ncbi:hypothetical protein OROHE_019296 [Orobanche hederae]